MDSLTRQEILLEYAKCYNNPIYLIEKYFKTIDKTRNGTVPFILFPKQREIITSYEGYRFNIIAKPRQAGVSTTTAAYYAYKLAFAEVNNPEKILILANKQLMAQEFLNKVKEFLLQVPRWIWGPEYYGTEEKEKKTIFSTANKGHLKLPNDSEVKALATSKDALRGFTPSRMCLDESGFIDNGVEVFNAAMTSLGCITKDTLILTENGLVELNEIVKEKENIGFTDLINPYKVCNMNRKLTDATKTFVSEYGETYKIRTKLGLEFEGSWKHPLLIKKNN